MKFHPFSHLVWEIRDFTQDAGALRCSVRSSIHGSFQEFRLPLQHSDEAGARGELGLDRLVHAAAPHRPKIL